jgi:hypothetical protein
LLIVLRFFRPSLDVSGVIHHHHFAVPNCGSSCLQYITVETKNNPEAKQCPGLSTCIAPIIESCMKGFVFAKRTGRILFWAYSVMRGCQVGV